MWKAYLRGLIPVANCHIFLQAGTLSWETVFHICNCTCWMASSTSGMTCLRYQRKEEKVVLSITTEGGTLRHWLLLPCLSSPFSPGPYHRTQKPSVPPSFGHWWRSHHWPGPTGSTPAAASAAHPSYLCYVHWCWKLLRRNNPLGKRPETEELLGILIHLWFHTLLNKSPVSGIFPQTHLYLPDWVLEDSQSLQTHLVPHAYISHLQFHTPCRKWYYFVIFIICFKLIYVLNANFNREFRRRKLNEHK